MTNLSLFCLPMHSIAECLEYVASIFIANITEMGCVCTIWLGCEIFHRYFLPLPYQLSINVTNFMIENLTK